MLTIFDAPAPIHARRGTAMLLVVAAIAAWGIGARAQSGMATAPRDGSTGPTVPDSNPVDARALDRGGPTAPRENAGSTTPAPPDVPGGQASNGLNTDPETPSVMPGPGAGANRER